ncbi:MAG: amidohydrolase [Cyclobacteriaceae bacterium]|nr:MAG: amidohydrolase [Cyclobacteriaceae bacterium]
MALGQDYDLLIKHGHLIDPKNGIDGVMDVAVKDGKIARVAANINAQAGVVVDAGGKYVTPGILDIHTHNFHGNTGSYLANGFSSVQPDGFTFKAGVTTVVDVGSSGWRNFEQFKSQTIDKSKTRVLAFLNIVGTGMKGGSWEQDLNDMDGRLTAATAKRFPGVVVGVKVAHYFGPEWDPVERGVEAGTLADIPVMIDFGGVEPELSLEELFMEKLRPGDIFTHTFGHVDGRIPIVNDDGKLEPFVKPAQQRGIIFDVGHGGGSFRFDQAVPAMEQGFRPNTISTDLHTGSMNGGMKDMLNVMSKFLNMGMNIQQVIEASTWKPAQVIKRQDLGHLTEGAVADIAIFSLREGNFGFIDVQRKKMEGTQKLECELTVRDGSVVYDLNGLASPVWNK